MSGENGNAGPVQQSKALVTGPKQRLELVRSELKRAQPSLQAMLPKHVSIDRVIRIVMAAVSRTPELLDCNPRSIVLATAQACALGLEPNTPLQLGYLVPFKKEATFIPGYKGLIRLAVQSGEVKSIQARCVYQHDHYSIEYGTDAAIRHTPATQADAGPMVGVYAIAELENRSKLFEFMSRAQVDAIKNRSKAASSGPWVTDYEEMAKKTAIRRLCKVLPLSEEKLARALQHQAAAENGEPDFSDVIDVLPDSYDPETGEVTEPPTRTESMADRVAAKAAGAA